MDCRSVHLLLDIERPWASELDAAEALALRDHLAACPACAALAERERRVEDQFGRAVRDVHVPAGLRERLVQRLAVQRSAQRRRRVLRVAAVAACLLLGLGLWWYWDFYRRPEVNVFAIVGDIDSRAFNTPERVKNWFQERGVAMVAPQQFNDAALNYSLLDSFGMADFQGVRVPHLLFFHQGRSAAVAHVYVLSDRSFNFDDPALATSANGSTHRVALFRHPDDPHVAYVVIYTGESLAPFFVDQRPGV